MNHEITMCDYTPTYPRNINQICKSQHPGWEKLIRKLFDDMFEAGWNGRLLQIKDKFGMLRVYVEPGNKAVLDLTLKAEVESFHLCQKCGEPGTRSANGWSMNILCDKHKPAEKPKEN